MSSLISFLSAVGPYVGFVAIFSFVVVIHELGHYLAARWCKVPVIEFSLGFPGTPILWQFWQHRETAFTVRLLPFGGFVRFVDAPGDDGEDTGKDMSFEGLTPGKKVVILAAGGVVNLIVGFLLLVVAIMGIKGLGMLDSALFVCQVMQMIITGTLSSIVSLDISNVSGPVGAAVASRKVMMAGLLPIVGFAGLMSVAIGIMNMLPLPGADGFYIDLAGLEAVRGKTLSRRTHAVVGAAGFAFVLLFMVVVTYHDVVRMFSGNGS